ncbi:hypothetical protein DTW90_11090 [Neorhizobium sp. P12A]|nr:hypothetical protein DTW90_11090 [Neorhizobium sp. P12A]
MQQSNLMSFVFGSFGSYKGFRSEMTALGLVSAIGHRQSCKCDRTQAANFYRVSTIRTLVDIADR